MQIDSTHILTRAFMNTKLKTKLIINLNTKLRYGQCCIFSVKKMINLYWLLDYILYRFQTTLNFSIHPHACMGLEVAVIRFNGGGFM